MIHHMKKLKDKNHDYLNRCRESLWQNSTAIYDKKQSRKQEERNIPQYKSYIWQTHRKHYPQWQKIGNISTKIRNKTKVPTITTIIQHNFGSSCHINQRRKRNKRIQIGKEIKLSLFADDMILYLENRRDATRKLLQLINKHSKVVGYYINT